LGQFDQVSILSALREEAVADAEGDRDDGGRPAVLSLPAEHPPTAAAPKSVSSARRLMPRA
jgi:hypothetical protein